MVGKTGSKKKEGAWWNVKMSEGVKKKVFWQKMLQRDVQRKERKYKKTKGEVKTNLMHMQKRT